MKHIKTYENNKRLRLGNYVIVHEVTTTHSAHLNKFFDNNIGKYVKYDIEADNKYCIEYENVPDEMQPFFFDSGDFQLYNSNSHIRWFDRYEIIHFSNNKEDLKLILTTNKYNL